MAASSRRFFSPDKKRLAILAFVISIILPSLANARQLHWLGFLLNTTPDENRGFSFFSGNR